MNSGTGWTKQRKKALHEAEQSVKHITRPSRHIYTWIFSLGILTICAGLSFWIVSSSTSASQQIQQTDTAREQINQAFSHIFQRLSEEKSYRRYAFGVANTIVANGGASFANSPLLSKWPHNDPNQLDSIVNKQHPIYPLNFTPQLEEVACGSGGIAELVPSAKDDFTALCGAAAAANASLLVTSSYRSYDDQADTYLWWVVNRGEAAAESASALPGYSEHQLGLSVDFATPSGMTLEDFTGSVQQKWLQENSWKYGFIQRYTEAGHEVSGYDTEVWHYRYVGRSVAAAYIKSGASSLEQYWHISGGSYKKAIYTTMPAEAK